MKFWSALPSRTRFLAIAILTAVLVSGAGLGIAHISSRDAARLSTAALSPSPSVSATPQPSKPNIVAINKMKSTMTPKPSPQASVSPQVTPASPQARVEAVPQVKPYFGHLPYQEDDASRLVTVGRFVRGTYERSELLDVEAAQAFQQMAAAARAQGIGLMPISGFRSIADQKALFERQIERQGSAEAAARLSAPPGYSEHHTGYALDIADEQRPDADLKRTFQETNACRWLEANAYRYGFEQSFPQNNKQGVSFEPWHWRYVTSERAAKVFAIAKF